MRNPGTADSEFNGKPPTPWSLIIRIALLGLSILSMAFVFFQQPVNATEHTAELATQFPGDIAEIDYDSISSGSLYLAHAGGNYSNAIVLSTSIQMDISGIVNKVTLVQSFENTSTDWVEGIYVFPLPTDAAVNRLDVQVGERNIAGRIMEKKQAVERYQHARKTGKIAGLVSQLRPNLFTTRIANIAPGEMVRVTLGYVQTLSYRDDKFSLRFPMTLTPRYSNAQVGDANEISPPQHYPDAITSPTATLAVTLHAKTSADSVRSPSHKIVVRESEQQVAVTFDGAQLMDRDLLLEWSPSLTQTPAVSSWLETVGDEDYLLTMLLPPKRLNNVASEPRELILVIDTSGSMAGISIEAAKAALHHAVDGLRVGDRFNLIEFNSTARRFFSASVKVNENNLQRAHRQIDQLSADGGTEMQTAIQLALANPLPEFLRQVVFVTDGSVGNEEQLFRQINNNIRQARLFTVGIGNAPNSYFMRRAALRGRGTYTWIDQANSAQEKISQLLGMLENPALTDIGVAWHGDIADYSPSPIADLYLGEPLILSAMLREKTTGFTVSGRFAGEQWEHQVDIRDTPITDSGLSTVWARRKIASLIDAQHRSTEADKYKNTITRIALDHQLITPYTSMVAIDTTPVRPQPTALAVASVSSLMPAGNTMTAVNFPQGATGSDSLLAIALICTLLAVLILTFQHINRRHYRRFGV